MLRALLALHHTKKYTVIVEHPVEDLDEASDRKIEDTMQMLHGRLHRIITLLGHRPRGLSVGACRGGVSARAVVRLPSDEGAARLLEAITLHLRGDDQARVVTGDQERLGPVSLLPEMAWPAR